jgi:dihydrofolate synthase/folylpolyglutamate synthase
MNYAETLSYLYAKLPIFSRTGAAAIKEGLGNIGELCASLGDPHRKFPSVHIAGTNGKGSTSHMLAAIFQVAGYKTGLYTSPHLHDFRERIRINGEMISEKHVVDFVERINPQIEKLQPSFFEVTVAMAFDLFASEAVDIAIIEVGLGGRLDSTNIITPELSVITNISWDHMNLLGDTLEKIAAEKAGIIKKSVPVVVGELDERTAAIFELAAHRMEAEIVFASDHRLVTDWQYDDHFMIAEVSRLHSDSKSTYRLDLPGIYQQKNLVTVLEAVKMLEDKWKIEEAHVQKALMQVKKLTGLHGRWETIHLNPRIVLDVAHNEAGISSLVEQIELTSHHTLRIIIGMVKDKEIDVVLSLLPAKAKYYFTKATIPRALNENDLKAKALENELHGHAYPNVNEAVRAALNESDKDDLILVCGSVFVVGELDRNLHAWH